MNVIRSAWLKRVTEVVDQALAADLNVILNDHNFEDLHEHPDANRDKLAAIWRQVAAHFADRPTTRLWFEIENEPHGALTNANLLATLAPALAEIRATNPDRPVVIGGGNWSGIDSLATLELPDDPNVHPTFHYYEPFDFTHQGATWAGPVPKAHTRDYGTPADAERLVDPTAARCELEIEPVPGAHDHVAFEPAFREGSVFVGTQGTRGVKAPAPGVE